ncbi:FecR family protein [Mucilaginibacter mallensis]|uniref:FecR family protein n=1 Tax=Mucilaginibacter mallensis TaxID=652787 RepID=A0A1H2CDX7_MUCMA|nr:FecR family protein [Mucilaginibacter mallensis]SDT68452.1 FecR family protein [Mucilaginibacter mallensis]
MTEEISDDLLVRHILGETTPAEEQLISQWINESNTNAKKLEQFRFILESSKELAMESPADEEIQWEKFKAKRASNRNSIIVPMNKPYKLWLQIVASIFLICGLATGGYYIFNLNSNIADKLITVTTQNNVLTDTLPDGSTVQLNSHSSINYSNNFKKQRTIKLSGEAFFIVKHNADIPFTVQAANVNIRDIGTSFNVKSKPDYLEVIVETGIVKVSRQAASIVLKRHEMIHLLSTDKNLSKETNSDLLYSYYRNGQFELNNTPLSRIVAVFNEIYGAHIRIEGQDLNNIPLTVTLKKDSLEKMLQILLLTSPELKMKKSGDEIILTK